MTRTHLISESIETKRGIPALEYLKVVVIAKTTTTEFQINSAYTSYFVPFTPTSPNPVRTALHTANAVPEELPSNVKSTRSQ